MAEIPRIKREQNLSVAPSPTVSTEVPETKEYAQEAVGKALGAGVDYFHKQLEVASDDYVRRSYNDYRDEFNTGYNAGYEDEQALSKIEGLEQFNAARDRLTDRLNKKTEKLLSDPNINGFTREKLKLKLDDATSTFNFYMDTQQGQVKLKNRASQSKNELEHQSSDLMNFMQSYNPSGDNPLIDRQIQKMKDTYDTNLVGAGLASKVTTEDKDGNPVTKLEISELGQYQKDKDMSASIAAAITELGVNQPTKALIALETHKDNIPIKETRNRLAKSLKSTADLQESYTAALTSVKVLNDSPAAIKEKMQKYAKDGRPELAKAYYQHVVDISNKDETLEKNMSETAMNNLLRLVLALPTKPNSIEEARLQDPEVEKWWQQIRPMDQASFGDKYFKPPRATSVEALTEMDDFLVSGSSDSILFNRLLTPLNKKARENAILRFRGIRTDLKNVDNTKLDKDSTSNAYVSYMRQANRNSEDFYPDDDAAKKIEVESKLIEWIEKSGSTIPSIKSNEGLKQMEVFLENHTKDVKNIPTFSGGKKLRRSSTMTDAEAKAEADRIKYGRSKI